MEYINEETVANALVKQYPTPMYAFLRHVRNHTGYGSNGDGTRTADAIALGLWASRGHALEGFEIKVDRQDWIKEWKDPSKAEAIAKYCDYWWIVEGLEGIVELEELPHGWGLKRLVGGHIKTIVEAEENSNVEPLSRQFLCGFMRNVTESINKVYTPTADVDKIIEEKTKAGITYELSRGDQKIKDYDILVAKVENFEKISGLDMSDVKNMWWKDSDAKLANAVKFIKDGRHIQLRRSLEYLLNSAKNLSNNVQRELDALPVFEDLDKND
jgi:hypothetical protein